ncbi:MAG TPA: endo-1,4-beta-xylanase, partial [Patescibacteria group bacterium]|nr:endo-1,4-beta-xylanase [Patescibacteria group bacterium]
KYAKLGLPIHFTETTILSGAREGQTGGWGASTSEGEEAQADQAANFYTMLFAHPALAAITWWDFSDYHAWQNAPAGLVRKDMSAKPVYDRLLELIKHQWWTNVELMTDENGTCGARGYYGSYRISADGADGCNLLVGRHRSNQVTLKL